VTYFAADPKNFSGKAQILLDLGGKFVTFTVAQSTPPLSMALRLACRTDS